MKHSLIYMTLLGIFSLLPLKLWSEIRVDTAVGSQQAWADHPLQINVLITHPSKKIVDNASFIFEKHPITVSLVKEEKVGPDELISIYSFQIPGKPAGLYWLAPVQVTIQGVVYGSAPTSYSITETAPIPESPHTLDQTVTPQTTAHTSSAPLSLQAYADAPMPLYPGERVHLIYRYLFSSNIDLTTEKLPMLEAQGFKKIGDVEIRELQHNKVSIHEVSQLVEALAPGEYTFGPSYVEGLAYTKNLFGNKSYSQQKFKAEAPDVTITVAALPLEGKNAAFGGAIGQFSIDSELQSPSNIAVGDLVKISVTIAGKGEMSSVELPVLLCQPGFSGLFYMSNKPIVGATNGQQKRFDVELRALSSLATEVPGISFTYFNPETHLYETIRSTPEPLTVRPGQQQLVRAPEEALMP
jgi:hypothetical protein